MKRAIFLMFLMVFTVGFAKENVNIGIIYDVKNYEETIKPILKDELTGNFSTSVFSPSIKEEVYVKDQDEFNTAMKKMQDDQNIKTIITIGFLASESTLESQSDYKKLVIAPYGIRSHEKKIKNLSYISEEVNVVKDLEFLQELKPIKKIGLVIPEYFSKGYLKTSLDKEIETIEDSGYSVNLILANEDRKLVAQALEGIDALYISEASYADVEDIIKKATENNILTFARISTDSFKDNVFLSYDNSLGEKHRIRAGVTSLVRRLNGNDPKDIVTNIDGLQSNINLNMRIGREISIYPNTKFSQKVNIFNDQKLGSKELSFLKGINFALNDNPDVKAKRQSITTGEYGVKSSKSYRRPQLDAFTEFNKTDTDSASQDGTPAENNLNGGISLNYLLFDDEVNTNVVVKDYEKQAAEEKLKQEKLNIVRTFSRSYLDILELNSKLSIQEYNYRLMKEFLQVAQTKYNLGESGPEDIYRFESEVSDAQTNIAEIKGLIQVAEADLNRLLDRPMAATYRLEPLKVDSKPFKDITNVLNKNIHDTDKMRTFFIDEGISNAPELKEIDLYIKSKKREVKSAKRERYLPKVKAFGEWSGDVKKDWGEGSSDTDDGDGWNVGTRVELPLFEGGNIEYRKRGFESELSTLKHQRDSLEGKVSKKVAASFAEVVKDYIQIETSHESAVSAKKNLDLVKDFYIKGTTSITELLDARTNSLSANEFEMAARYSYLKSLVDLERSSGEYLILMDDIDKNIKINKLKKTLN